MLPEKFKEALVACYGAKDCVSGAALSPNDLTIDHRVPYRVSGDEGLSDFDVSAFMLLDRSTQRSKSWACEACKNWQDLHDPAICGGCFWAYPEHYEHVAMVETRRTNIVFEGDDLTVHERLRARAEAENISIGELLLRLARNA